MAVLTRRFDFDLENLHISLDIVANVEDLVTDPNDEDQIPYWAELWPASRGLARYIWEEVDFAGAAVLELGAGLGLPGLVAALKGGRVTLTDYKPEALELAGRNAARNGIEGVSLLLADWRDFPCIEQYDWVIGSDVLYNPRLNPYVAGILARILAPGGQLLFAHPGRKVTFEFLQGLKDSLGLREKRSTVPVTVEDQHYPFYEIDIHHLYK
ncbi:MAG TPA: methyltransferase domain-containing protein [Syntrophomonadaceae bacterium]|nr:methyltransferase domain-containing protein [Syntrophomonadaceae bacterium]